jgi:hypothetical protein
VGRVAPTPNQVALLAVPSMWTDHILAAVSIYLSVQVISGVSGPAVSMWPVAKSVLLFLGVPLLAGGLRYSWGATLLTPAAGLSCVQWQLTVQCMRVREGTVVSWLGHGLSGCKLAGWASHLKCAGEAAVSHHVTKSSQLTWLSCCRRAVLCFAVLCSALQASS